MLPLNDMTLLKQQCYVGGRWIASETQQDLTVINPADGSRVATVPVLSAGQVQDAIETAHRAGAAWRQQTAKQRATALRRWFELIMANQEDLAVLMTAEQGKPLSESRGEIAYAGAFIEWFSEEAKRVYGDTIPAPQADQRIVVLKQPVGLCAAITPWNFPAAMITRKAGAALAAGCTMIVKPASQTPLTALALAELAHRAGIPEGVLNVITGASAVIGSALTASHLVRKLSFTGSTEVGKALMRQCADTVKKVSLELGGHAPFIVFDDADIDAAVAGAMASKYRNAGQTCVCANRLLVQDDIYEEFSSRLVTQVKRLKVASGMEAGAQQGPLIDAAALAKVEHQIREACLRGAKILTGGKPHALGGTFFEPTVLSDVTTDMIIAQEETFGPVAPLMRFSDEAEVVEIANATDFGLAGYFFSRDMARIWRVAEALDYGIVGINTGIISTEVAPFGGMKQSGIGREGSKYGIDEYLEIKYLCMGGLTL